MADESVVKLKVNDEMYEVDFNDLDLAEAGAIEELCGASIYEVDWYSARGVQGLVWVAMRRQNERFTLAEAGRLKVSMLEVDPAEEPTNGNGKPAAKKRPTKA